MHSIIVAYRNRIKCLPTFLESIFIAKHIANTDVEVVISDLNSKDGSLKFLNKNKDKYNVKVISNKYDGPFWKTKALNNCVLNASFPFITMLDVDSLVPPLFFDGINKYIEKNKNKFKIAHRVRFLDLPTSKVLYENRNNINASMINRLCVKRSSRFRMAIERYTREELKLSNIQNSLTIAECIRNKALGNSHFTTHKDHYLEIGGYDERFIGHGLEDLDFNLRLFKHLKHGHLKPSENYTVFHVAHNYFETNWYNQKLIENNRQIYRKNKRKNIICIPLKADWGKF